jgi:hypothetical protein
VVRTSSLKIASQLSRLGNRFDTKKASDVNPMAPSANLSVLKLGQAGRQRGVELPSTAHELANERRPRPV